MCVVCVCLSLYIHYDEERLWHADKAVRQYESRYVCVFLCSKYLSVRIGVPPENVCMGWLPLVGS